MFSQSNHCLMVLKPRIQSFLWWNPKFSPQISQLDTSWSTPPRPGKCCCRPRLLGGHGISWSHGWCVCVWFCCHVDIPLKQLEEKHTHTPLWYIYCVYVYIYTVYILYMYCIYTVYILYIYIHILYIYTYTPLVCTPLGLNFCYPIRWNPPSIPPGNRHPTRERCGDPSLPPPAAFPCPTRP